MIGVSEKPTFNQIYKDTFLFVFKLVKKQGVHNSLIDDIVQEIFITVHRQLPGFEFKSEIKTWLYSITINYINNYRRTKRRKGNGQAIISNVFDPDDLICNHSSQYEAYKRVQASKIFNNLISKMDKNKAEVLLLHEFEEMTIVEIAEFTKVNRNTVSSRIRVGRKQFETLLSDYNK